MNGSEPEPIVNSDEKSDRPGAFAK